MDKQPKSQEERKLQYEASKVSNLANLKTVVTCDQCGSVMVEKIGKYGKYYGCSNFPKCSKTMTKERRREKIQAAIKVSEIITAKRAAERKNQPPAIKQQKKSKRRKKAEISKKEIFEVQKELGFESPTPVRLLVIANRIAKLRNLPEIPEWLPSRREMAKAYILQYRSVTKRNK